MPGPSSQSQTVALPKRFPLVPEPANRDETTAKDARLVNAYVETHKDSITGQSETWIFERFGLLQQGQPSGGSATGRGIFNWKGNLYSVIGSTLYKDTTSKGTVDTTGGVYRFNSSLGGTPKLQLGNGVKAYNYDDAGGLVLINDADFPAAFVKGMPYLDGTSYVMTSAAKLQGSNLNDPVNWDALNFLTAQIEPDGGVFLAKQLVYIIAFKQWTTEVFYDAGNATGSPLGSVQGGKINYGCLTQESVQDIDGALFWVCVSRQSAPQVMMLENAKAEIISTKAVERLIRFIDTTTFYSFSVKHDGHKFYVFTSVTSNLTLAYDIAEKRWAQWTDASGNYFPIVSSAYDSSTKCVLQHESNGKLYFADTAYNNDDGSIITVDIYTPNTDLGTKRGKMLSMLEVVADQKVGAELLIRCNDSDYDPKKWTNFRRVDLSKKKPFLGNCGTFKRRAYHLRYAKPVRMPRIAGLEMQLDLCTL